MSHPRPRWDDPPPRQSCPDGKPTLLGWIIIALIIVGGWTLFYVAIRAIALGLVHLVTGGSPTP